VGFTSHQKALARFVNKHDGSAQVGERVSDRHDWDTVRKACHRPSVDWK
jgi:hypothetical protein